MNLLTRNKKYKRILFASTLLLSSMFGFAQRSSKVGEFDVSFLPSPKGGIMLLSGKKHSLTIEIKGDSIQPTDQSNFVLVDNQIFQASLVPLPDRSDARVMPLARQKEVLSGYVGYEFDYFQKQLKLDARNLKREWILNGGKQYLLWYFDLLQHDSDKNSTLAKPAIRQVYLSILWRDQVFDLNSALVSGKDIQSAKSFLLQIARSIKTYEGRVDVASFSRRRE